MNGFIAKTLTAAFLASGGLSAVGCYGYRDLVDPCYPERYTYESRQEVKASMAPQVQNGHILDQTIWNYHFVQGTAELTPMGMEKLAELGRRRPAPDPVIYLQVAGADLRHPDLPYDPANPQAFVDARNTLDAKRVKAIQDCLNALTCGRNVTFTVVRHDPAEVGLNAIPASISVRNYDASAQGNLVRTSSSFSGGGGGGVTGGR
jgi:hypothetical protein